MTDFICSNTKMCVWVINTPRTYIIYREIRVVALGPLGAKYEVTADTRMFVNSLTNQPYSHPALVTAYHLGHGRNIRISFLAPAG